MVNRAYICFCCTRDINLLRYVHASIRRLDDNSPVYYAFDKFDEVDGLIVGDGHIIKTGFRRDGNLNGNEAVRGEVLTMLQLDAQQVVKIDADTLLVDDEWIEEGCDVGFHSANGYYWTGCCYALTRQTLAAIHEYLSVHTMGRHNGYTLPEDQTMTMLSAVNHYGGSMGGRFKILENEQYLCLPYCHWCWGAEWPEGLAVVHCGQWQRLKTLSEHGYDRTTVVSHDMEIALGAISRQKPRRK